MMTQKTDHIIDAAQRMFTRYGYSKTTMGDIAQEAGVARQTLYNAFPGKDEILRATMRRVGDRTVDAVKSAWERLDTVEEKIDVFLALGPIAWYEMVQASPEAADLIEGMHAAAEEVMECHARDWEAELTAMIEATHGPADPGGPPLADIVEYFYAASINVKYGARDVSHLKQRLAVLKASVLALL